MPEHLTEIFKMNGKIFDIKRFAVHDGNGIRTTVFLKGCSMKCVWCQNPEGISIENTSMYFKNRCIKCRICEKFTDGNGAVFENDNLKKKKISDENMKKIIENCPVEAVQKSSKEMSAEEVVNEILKDKVFFKNGGGATFSGGEPLLQKDFLIEVLKKLKEKNINTAVETALNVETETLKDVLPYLDFIYADLKIFDREKHKKYTGVFNELIKKNIKFLLESSKKENVVIRTPMIPEFTAYEENIKEISRYISEIYHDVKYEILNYNPLAESKYEMTGKEYCFEKNPPLYTKEEMKNFGNIAEKNGIKKIIIES